jgi:hypothetical protein
MIETSIYAVQNECCRCCEFCHWSCLAQTKSDSPAPVDVGGLGTDFQISGRFVDQAGGPIAGEVVSFRIVDSGRPIEFKTVQASLGELTGGRSYDVQKLDRAVMAQILQGLVGTLRTEYIIGFSPEMSGNPTRHTLEVRLRDKALGKVIGGKRSVSH